MVGTRGFVLSLLLAATLVAAAHGADKKERRKPREAPDNHLGAGFDMRPPPKDASQLELYQHLFHLKRREQIETSEKVVSISDYTKQYKTITMLLETLFPVIEEAMRTIEKAGYTPDMPFPEDRDMQEVLGKVYENVIMFGDFLLRMPDITKKVYNSHKEWVPILRWAVKFCSESPNIFSGPHATQLELMKQEIGIGPRNPKYVNPFSGSEKQKNKAQEDDLQKRLKMRREALEEKMKNQKGPRLRKNRHNEL